MNTSHIIGLELANYWISNFTAFIITLLIIKYLRPIASRLGIVASPDERKLHTGCIPLIGGIGMAGGLLFALLTLSISLLPYRSLIAGCALLVIIGIIDDLHEISAKKRLIFQIFAAILMVSGKNILYSLGELPILSYIIMHFEWTSILFTIIAVIGMVNAMNMIDGMDGLAGSLAFITSSFILYIAFQARLTEVIYLVSLLISVLLAFLWFNLRIFARKHALIFMGDAGSMLLGYILAWFLIELSQGPYYAARPVTMLWIFAIPLFDMIGVTLLRFSQNRPPFSPGRDHIHHLLQNYGFTNNQIVLMLSCAAIVLGLVGILGETMNINETKMFISFLIMFGCNFAMIFMGHRRLAFNKQGKFIS